MQLISQRFKQKPNDDSKSFANAVGAA
jgi:hypothetical protein